MADDGWVRIPPPTSRQRLLIAGLWNAFAFTISLNLLISLGRVLQEHLGESWLIMIGTIVVGEAVVLAIVQLLLLRRTGALDLHPDRGLIRLHGQERPTADIVGARVELELELAASAPDPDPGRRRRRPKEARDSIVLTLTADDGARISLVLAIRGRRVLSDEQTAALVAAVEASRIVLPTTSDDPDGRFTRINFPGHLDVGDAVELIRDPRVRRGSR